jgi:hypothetical protein
MNMMKKRREISGPAHSTLMSSKIWMTSHVTNGLCGNWESDVIRME